eukprot:scaffold22448_cov146-Isochrysis_galbana.AAC.3
MCYIEPHRPKLKESCRLGYQPRTFNRSTATHPRAAAAHTATRISPPHRAPRTTRHIARAHARAGRAWPFDGCQEGASHASGGKKSSSSSYRLPPREARRSMRCVRSSGEYAGIDPALLLAAGMRKMMLRNTTAAGMSLDGQMNV